MVKVSTRGLSMPASPIRKLVPYAEEAKKKGRKVYHLNIGQPDIQTPEVALEAIRNFDQKVIEYSHSAGFEEYRRKLVPYFKTIGIDIDHNNIIITTGGSEAIIMSFMTIMEPGDEIIIPEPFYANYNGFAAICGVKVVPVTSNIENGFALPPISDFEKLITPKTRAVLVCSPNNPTGYLYSQDEMNLLRDLVKKHDLYLLSDEVYYEYCYDGEKHVPAMSLEGIEDNVIMLDSVSKRYSECGVRIGALITKNKKVLEYAMRFAQARLSPPTLGQVAGMASLDAPADYFNNVREEYISRRNYLVDALNKIPGVMCPKPKGAFYCMARLPIDDSDAFAQWLLEEFNYNNQTVMLAPATGFYATPGLGKDEVRIAYVLKREDLEAAVECLAVALSQYPGRK